MFCRLVYINPKNRCIKPQVETSFLGKRRAFFPSPWQQFGNLQNLNNLQLFPSQPLSIEPYMKILGPAYQKLQPFPEPDFIKEMATIEGLLVWSSQALTPLLREDNTRSPAIVAKSFSNTLNHNVRSHTILGQGGEQKHNIINKTVLTLYFKAIWMVNWTPNC